MSEESVFTNEELGIEEEEFDDDEEEEESESSSVETQYDSESNMEFDDDEQEIPDLQFVEITLDEIDRKSRFVLTEPDDPSNFIDEDGKPMQYPRLVSGGSLPMISPHQSAENLSDPDFRIFNKSALEAYSEDFVKLLKYKMHIDQLAQQDKRKEIYELDEEIREPNEKIAKIISSLGDVVERFRENLTNLYDPQIDPSRKARRLSKRRTMMFKARGYKQMITVIEQYIHGLKTYGEYPEEMWKEFEEAKAEALKASNDDNAILYGSKILVCADYVLGDEPEIRPVKRITEGIAQPRSQD